LYCIIDLSASGVEGSIALNIQLNGRGVGKPGDPNTSFGGVRLKIGLGDEQSSQQMTLTEAKITNVIPVSHTSEAPIQKDHSLIYSRAPRETQTIFRNLLAGHLEIFLSFGLGRKSMQYVLTTPLDPQLIEQFNACSQKTNIYGLPFQLPIPG
jgi:hypothetical protein